MSVKRPLLILTVAVTASICITKPAAGVKKNVLFCVSCT